MFTNKNRFRTLYVGFSFKHHGEHSGYDLIRKCIAYDLHYDCQREFDFLQKLTTKRKILAKIYFKIFGNRLFWVEFRCILYSLLHKNIIFHFIYSENIYRYLGYFKGKTNKIVCTLHQPAAFFESNPKYLVGAKYIDRIIVLSKDMVIPIQEIFQTSEVHYIPHGVDTSYFKLSNHKAAQNLLMVGNWMRNFEFANLVFKRLLSINKHITIQVVTLNENYKYFDQKLPIKLMSNVTNDQLLHLYQNSDILFLPLNDFTANNTLLEGASCGCKIIIATNKNIDSSYLDKKYLNIIPFDIKLVSTFILKCLNEPNSNKNDISEFIKDNYAWSVIGKLTLEVLLNKYINPIN